MDEGTYSDTGAIINVLGIRDPQAAIREMAFRAEVRRRALELKPDLIKVKVAEIGSLKHAQQIHKHLYQDFLPKRALGLVRQMDTLGVRGPGIHIPNRRIAEESRKLHLELSAKIHDKTLGPNLTHRAAAVELAKYLQRSHEIAPFPHRHVNLAVQRVLVEQIAKSVGHEMKLGSRLAQVEQHLNARQTRELALTLEKAMARTPGQNLAPSVSLGKSQAKIIEKRAAIERRREQRLEIERNRSIAHARTVGLNLGPAQSVRLTPEMKEAQEKFRALQPELSPGQRLAIERANATEKKQIEEALRLVREKSPEIAKTLEKKLAEEQSKGLAMGPPSAMEALKKSQEISKGQGRGLRPY